MARGDHIYVWRLLFLYQHHGIDCGDGTVIHHVGMVSVDENGIKTAPIQRTSMQQFSQGEEVLIQDYDFEECDVPDKVIERAKSCLGNDEYHLVWNNCEHFATWCKTGEDKSQQILDIAEGVGRFLGKLFSG
jgi:hypothetical protein